MASEREQYPSAHGLSGEARRRWALRRGLAIARTSFTEADLDRVEAERAATQASALKEQIRRMEGK